MDKTILKGYIERLRYTNSKIMELDNTGLFNDTTIESMEGPIVETAYDMLKQLYDNKLPEDDDYIFEEFTDYMRGHSSYMHISDFMNWMEGEVEIDN